MCYRRYLAPTSDYRALVIALNTSSTGLYQQSWSPTEMSDTRAFPRTTLFPKMLCFWKILGSQSGGWPVAQLERHCLRYTIFCPSSILGKTKRGIQNNNNNNNNNTAIYTKNLFISFDSAAKNSALLDY